MRTQKINTLDGRGTLSQLCRSGILNLLDVELHLFNGDLAFALGQVKGTSLVLERGDQVRLLTHSKLSCEHLIKLPLRRILTLLSWRGHDRGRLEAHTLELLTELFASLLKRVLSCGKLSLILHIDAHVVFLILLGEAQTHLHAVFLYNL